MKLSIKKSLSNLRSFSKPLLPQITNYDKLVSEFKWNIPKHFNIGFEISDKHVLAGNGKNTAMIFEDHGTVKNYSFDQISKFSNKFAIALSKLEYKLQDRVAILLGQVSDNFKLNLVS